MVGPGTGIAPFSCIYRRTKSNRGQAVKTGCFLGISQSTDYLYQNEWETYQKDSILTDLDLAWSRDQTEKVYVQHKMLEKKEQLWSWLGEGAVFYVCGDASRMAKDVDQALRTIAQEEGSMSEEDASLLG